MYPECYIFRGSQQHVKCLPFRSFGCERAWWRLFLKRVMHIQLDVCLFIKYAMVVFHWLYIESRLVAIPSWVVGWLTFRRQIFLRNGTGQARTKYNSSFIIYGKGTWRVSSVVLLRDRSGAQKNNASFEM